VPMTKRPSTQIVEKTTIAVQKLADRLGHAAALGLLYAYVLRRPIDNGGLVTRLARVHSDISEYRRIVEEVMYSEEAAAIHGSSMFATLHPVEYLTTWFDPESSILELPE